MFSKIELITRKCALETCDRTFRVWPESSQAIYCCRLHKPENIYVPLKTLLFPYSKSEEMPHLEQLEEEIL